MDLLYANDQQGHYPKSWYAATANDLSLFPPLGGDIQADVCVVGAGYTGVSAALHLAEAGRKVVLLEAHRIGFGASGRNGGQLGSGQRVEQDQLEKWVGRDDAHKLWQLAEDSKDLVKALVAKHNIDCHLKPGILHAGFSKSDVRHEHDYVKKLQDEYGYGQIEALDHDQVQEICPSPKYVGGSLDMGAGHVHPLNLVLGIGDAAHRAGVQIFENTHVEDITPGRTAGEKTVVRTSKGRVVADQVILACNGYLGGLNRKVAARVMPINNFIAATRPLGDDIAKVLRRDVAVADTKFVINYFRLGHDNRLLFGGGETYGYRFPDDIASLVRKPMAEIYPELRDIEIDYAWGGTLAITMKRFPYLARVAPNVLSASGYSGHGVGTATHAGQLMAEAVIGQSDGFDTMCSIPTNPFPGGSALRSPLLVMAMTWFALRDRLGV